MTNSVGFKNTLHIYVTFKQTLHSSPLVVVVVRRVTLLMSSGSTNSENHVMVDDYSKINVVQCKNGQIG